MEKLQHIAEARKIHAPNASGSVLTPQVSRVKSRDWRATVYNRFGMPYHNPIPEDRRGKGGDAPKKDSGGLATLIQAEKMMQIALLLPCAAFIGWLIGAWFDKMFHQSWIGIAGIVFGGISGLVYVIRLVIHTDAGGKSGGGSQL